MFPARERAFLRSMRGVSRCDESNVGVSTSRDGDRGLRAEDECCSECCRFKGLKRQRRESALDCYFFDRHCRHNVADCDGLNNVESGNGVAEEAVLLRKTRLITETNEELGAVGVWARVRHGNGAISVIALNRFIGEFVTRTTGAIACRASTLDNETGDDAVECESVVEASPCEGDEIVHRVWCDARIKIHDNLALRGRDRDAVDG